MHEPCSDYDDGDPDGIPPDLTFWGVIGLLLALWIVLPLIDAADWMVDRWHDLRAPRRNPRRARWLSIWGQHVVAAVGLVVFIGAMMILTGAQP